MPEQPPQTPQRQYSVTLLTYVVVAFLKRHEGLDVYDYGTRFNPLWVEEVIE